MQLESPRMHPTRYFAASLYKNFCVRKVKVKNFESMRYPNSPVYLRNTYKTFLFSHLEEKNTKLLSTIQRSCSIILTELLNFLINLMLILLTNK